MSNATNSGKSLSTIFTRPVNSARFTLGSSTLRPCQLGLPRWQTFCHSSVRCGKFPAIKMSTELPEEISKLLVDWSNGDRDVLDQMMPLVYEELHRLAHGYMVRERVGHTLQTTALVNEVYLKLAKKEGMRLQSRAHFLALAARQMRHILVDYAWGHAREKRGGDANRVQLDEALECPWRSIPQKCWPWMRL